MDWLLKTEPSDYSYEDLAREKRTTWSGVRNPLARKHLSLMTRGDRVVVYHTGAVRAAVGIAKVVSGPRPDPADASGVVVDVAAVRHLHAPVPLRAIKASPLFAGSPLLASGRLSVVALTHEQYSFLAGHPA